jgi:hypothetical protein
MRRVFTHLNSGLQANPFIHGADYPIIIIYEAERRRKTLDACARQITQASGLESRT